MKKILSAVMAMVMLFTLGLTQISAEETTAQESVKFYSNGKTYNLTNGQVIHATAEGRALIGATVLSKDMTVTIEDGEVFFESSGWERQIGFPLSTNGKTYKYFKLHIKSAAAFTGVNGLRVHLQIPDSKGVLTTYLYNLGVGNDKGNPLVLDILAGEHDYYLDVTKFISTADGTTALTVEDTAKVSRFYLNDQGWHGDITWGLGECEFTNNSVLPLVTMDTEAYQTFADKYGGVGNPISATSFDSWTGYNLQETNAKVRRYLAPSNKWKIINYRGGLAFEVEFSGSVKGESNDNSNSFQCLLYAELFKSKISDYDYFRFWAKTVNQRKIIFGLYSDKNCATWINSVYVTIPANYEGWVYIPVSEINDALSNAGKTLNDVNSMNLMMRDWEAYAGTVIFDEVELCTSNEEKDLRSPVIKLSTFTDEPVLVKKTSKSVTFDAVKGMEYSLNGVDWQTSSEFTGLSAGKYLFYVRNAADPFGPHSVPVSIKVHKMGDIDGNGKVDASDITILKQKLLGIDVEADRFAVDVTENGVTDILDLVKIKKLSVTA